MKGIILAGGHGTRLYPITQIMCKQLLPIYDKPMIYYPLSTLMLAGIRDILIISTEYDLYRFKDHFKDGSHLGLNISYAVQDEPKGLAEAFIIGEEFIKDDSVCLVLGDNIFYGHDLPEILKKASVNKEGATVFGYYVNDPERYGVIEFDDAHNVISIEEKPDNPKSDYAVVGLYFYDNTVIKRAKSLKPSPRGELEITDLNLTYLKNGNLKVKLMGRGYAWLDTGTIDSLIDSALFIKTIEERQGLKISCLEEIAYKYGYISKEELIKIAKSLVKSGYGEYLLKIANEE